MLPAALLYAEIVFFVVNALITFSDTIVLPLSKAYESYAITYP